MSTRHQLAAQYVRMSTERQDISVELQEITNAAYAEARGYRLVSTYADKGISGVGIEKRAGLKRLIADVTSGQAGYSIILVYDVSRWGRFQNPDEAAHYEFLCAEAGLSVEYSAEPFNNDGSATSSLLKAMKRVMAAEYSRELSSRIHVALRTAAHRGYWTGGTPGYGYRREVENKAGEKRGVKGFREPREQGTHTRLVRGPPEEVAIVRRIYRQYVDLGLSSAEIARRLNAEGILSERLRPWSAVMVQKILTSEKYAGRFVRCKVRSRLGAARSPTEPSDWQRLDDIAPALVTRHVWNAAQAERRRRLGGPNRTDLLADFRRLSSRHPYLTNAVVRQHGRYRIDRYLAEFGSLIAGVREAGGAVNNRQEAAHIRSRPPETERGVAAARYDKRIIADLRRLYITHGYLTRALIAADPLLPHPSTYALHFGGLGRAFALVGYLPKGGQARKMREAADWTYPGEDADLAARANAEATDGFTPRDAAAEMSVKLQALLAQHGRLTRGVIDAAEGIPGSQALIERFGGLEQVYAMAGYTPDRHQRAVVAAARRRGLGLSYNGREPPK